MFRNKIIGFVSIVLLCTSSMFLIKKNKNEKILNHYISRFDINSLSNSVLIIELDGSVSIDVVVLKLEVEMKVNELSDKIKVEFKKLERYSKYVVIKFKYKNVSKVMEYELIVNDKNDDSIDIK